MSIREAREIIRPYRDILIFVVTLFTANAVWKCMVQGDERGYGDVTWCGVIATPVFDYLAQQTAYTVWTIISLFRDTLSLYHDTLLRFDNGNATRIIWGCTPLKQCFIWTCLIVTVLPLWGRNAGRIWLHKAWAIPVGWVAIWFINITRITIITLVIEQHPELFEVLHTYIFKYLFYGLLFLGWIGFTLLRDKVSPMPATE